ncbi:MAG TPA: hypothetical protein VMR98_05380 [Candidatus Polarisedimenticolaceae bacterium]|nr:hypothetical protein [Candidatus Polarisedimenticolaceae bacterium]
MKETFLTRNPDTKKKGVRVDKIKYDIIRDAIIAILRERGPLSFANLLAAMKERVDSAKFDGGSSVNWHTTTVRLDMEAKGELVYDRKAKKPLFVLP